MIAAAMKNTSHSCIARSYAKINLYLDVLNRRRDGFHNIETIFQSVGLYDELTFSRLPSPDIIITCTHPDVPCSAQNLVWKAAALLQGKTGCKLGARIHIQKQIPLEAGLAGGSGNAAAALIALDSLWSLQLPGKILRDCARELGSDVPFCLAGGTAAARMRGEELYPLDDIPPRWFVLVHPPVAVPTAFVYGHPELPRNREPVFAGWTRRFRVHRDALRRSDFRAGMFNCMETVVYSEYPQLRAVRDMLLQAGAESALMSGSGSTVFASCVDKHQADITAERLKNGTGWPVSVVPMVNRGVELLGQDHAACHGGER